MALPESVRSVPIDLIIEPSIGMAKADSFDVRDVEPV